MAHTALYALAALMVCIAGLHFYWAAGGAWGVRAAIPTLPGDVERALFKPGRRPTIAVAALFLAGAGVAMGWLLADLRAILLRLMAAVFALRAIGEFRYVGFFKSVRETHFAYWDTRLFSPLCLVLSLLALAGTGLFQR